MLISVLASHSAASSWVFNGKAPQKQTFSDNKLSLNRLPPRGLNATSTSRVAAARAMSLTANRRSPHKPQGQSEMSGGGSFFFIIYRRGLRTSKSSAVFCLRSLPPDCLHHHLSRTKTSMIHHRGVIQNTLVSNQAALIHNQFGCSSIYYTYIKNLYPGFNLLSIYTQKIDKTQLKIKTC